MTDFKEASQPRPAPPPGQGRGSRVQYTGQMMYDGREHEPWCKSPHPRALVECTCPASATLGWNTPLQTMSADQYDALYESAPMPRHKLLAIKARLNKLDPSDPRYVLSPQEKAELARKPYEVEKAYMPGRNKTLDEQLAALSAPASTPSLPQQTPPQPVTEYTDEELDIPFWEEIDAQWNVPLHQRSPEITTQSLSQPEFTPEQVERARRRAMMYRRPDQPPPTDQPIPQQAPPQPYPSAPQQSNQGVYPTQSPNNLNYAPISPHTAPESACRAPVLFSPPGHPSHLPPYVLECEAEPHPQGSPHMCRIPSRRPGQEIFVGWRDS